MDFRVLAVENDVHKVVVEFQLVHLHFTFVLYLLHQMTRSHIFVLFVDLYDEILDEEELWLCDWGQLLLWEELKDKFLKLVYLVRLTNALLAGHEVVEPFIVPFFLTLVVFHLIPNTLKGTHQDSYFIAKFVNESE